MAEPHTSLAAGPRNGTWLTRSRIARGVKFHIDRGDRRAACSGMPLAAFAIVPAAEVDQFTRCARAACANGFRTAQDRSTMAPQDVPGVDACVLVVDDDEQVRNDLLTLLEQEGHRVVAVPTISQGLAAPPPAVVVHDVHLRDGTLTDPVVAHYHRDGTFVIAFSGLPSDAPATADKVVSKSDFVALIDAVSEAMQAAPAEQTKEHNR